MRKITTFWLALLTTLCVSFTAKAALTVNLTWDIPDAIDVYVGGTGVNNKVTVPAGATTYTAVRDNTWGSAYVGAKSGYVVVKGICQEDGTELSVNAYSQKIVIDMSKYDGKTIKIEVQELIYDGTFNIHVINGRNDLSAQIGGTNREIQNLHTGDNIIPFSTQYEPNIIIYGKARTVEETTTDGIVQTVIDPTIDFEVKKNDVTQVAYVNKFSIKTGNITLADNDVITVKHNTYDDEPEEVVDTKTITMSYADQAARNAVSMMFNRTTMKTIALGAVDNFEATVGDVINITFNTYDYVVTVNGSVVEGPNGVTGESTTYSYTVEDNATIAISATEREYGTTSVTVNLHSPEGLELRAGTMEGELLNIADATVGSETTVSYKDGDNVTHSSTVTPYTFEVSTKSPKIYVSAQEGYWIEIAYYKDGNDVVESGVATDEHPLNVINHKIVPNAKVAFYLACDGGVGTDDFRVRDSQRNEIEITPGYNIFDVDPKYVGAYTVAPYVEQGTNFFVYENGNMVAANEDEGGVFKTGKVSDGTVIYIFAGRPAPTERTITVNTINPGTATVKLDKIREISLLGKRTFKAFNGAEITVTPGTAPEFYLDGDLIENVESKTFKVDDNHMIFLGNSATLANSVFSPSAGDIVKACESITVQFPKAAKVEWDEDADEPIILRRSDNLAQASFFDIEIESETSGVVLNVTPTINNQQGVPAGEWTITIPENFFIIDGFKGNAETQFTFTVRPDIKIEEVMVMPEDKSAITTADFKGIQIAYFGDLDITDVDTDMLEIKHNGTPLTANTDYEIYFGDSGEGFWAISIMPTNPATGKYSVNIPAGTITMFGQKYQGNLSFDFVVYDPATVAQYTTSPAADEIVQSAESITITFPNATSVTINEECEDWFTFMTVNQTKAAWNCVVAQVENAAVPTFTVTPDVIGAGTWRLTIPEGYFKAEGVVGNEAGELIFTIKPPVVVEEVLVEPGDGSKISIDDFYGINMAFVGEFTITGFDPTKFTVTVDEAELTYGTDYAIEAFDASDFWVLYISFPNPVAGAYSMTMQPGGVTLSDEAYGGTVTTAFEVVGHKDVNFHIGVNEGEEIIPSKPSLQDIAEIFICFHEAEKAEIVKENGATLFQTGDLNTYSVEPKAYGDVVKTAEISKLNNNSFKIAFDMTDVTEGDYRLNIAPGTFLIDDVHQSPAYEQNFVQLTGVIDIFVDGDGKVTIVSLNGQVIAKDAEPSAIKNLETGIYIVNGKKAFIKK